MHQLLTADEIPELLSRLVDKSLVQVDADGRYDLLQLVRQFGQEELMRSEDNAPTRTRHLHHFAEFCHQMARAMYGSQLFKANDAFAQESENIRLAVEWAVMRADSWPVAVRILNDMFWAYFARGAMSEGAALTSLVIDNTPDPHDPKDLATAWGWLSTYQQLWDHPRTIASCETAVRLGEHSENSWAIALGTFQKAMFDLRHGQLDELQHLLSRALAAVRTVTGPPARQMEFSVLTILGNSAVMAGRFEEAKPYYEDCRRICDDLGYLRGYAVLYGNLGHLSERLGEYETAHDYATKTLETFLKMNDFRNLAGTIADSASGYWVTGDYETAAQTVGCAYGIWGQSELTPDAIDYDTAERWRLRLKEKMGDEAFAAAFERGKTIPPKEMVEKILANPEPWASLDQIQPTTDH